MPECLSVTAHFNDLPMAICHEKDAVIAFQFHPESILTTYGTTLLSQSIKYLIELAHGLLETTDVKYQEKTQHLRNKS
jgi:anthranilate synthase component 2